MLVKVCFDAIDEGVATQSLLDCFLDIEQRFVNSFASGGYLYMMPPGNEGKQQWKILPYIISDVLKHSVEDARVKLLSYYVTLSQGLKPMASLKLSIGDQIYEQNASGDGQYDAFVRALRKIYKETLGRKFPMLTNYAVSIPPGGRTDAFVQTIITWEHEGKTFKTRGLDADQTEAAIKATIKMLNIIE